MISSPHTIFHVYNKNTIKIKKIFKNKNISSVSIEKEIEKIKENKNPYDGHLLNDLLNKDYLETPVTQKYSTTDFLRAGFRWNRINNKYLDKIFKLLDNK